MCRVLSVPVTTMVARKVGTSPSSVELPTAVVPDVSGGGGGGGGKAPPGPGESGDASSAGSPSSSCSWPCSSSSVSSSSGSSSCAFFLPLPFLPILAGRPTHRRRGVKRGVNGRKPYACLLVGETGECFQPETYNWKRATMLATTLRKLVFAPVCPGSPRCLFTGEAKAHVLTSRA